MSRITHSALGADPLKGLRGEGSQSRVLDASREYRWLMAASGRNKEHRERQVRRRGRRQREFGSKHAGTASVVHPPPAMHAAAKPGQTLLQGSGPSLELIDFSGFWTASYGRSAASHRYPHTWAAGSHGIELVEIQVHNGYLVARKV